jgi:uncharacterized repeat protein (TIGR04076 family)
MPKKSGHMDIKRNIWDKIKWNYSKKKLKYSKSEFEKFQSNPQNENMLTMAPTISDARIIATIIVSHGCNSEHKTGDQFVFDGFGNLLTELTTNKICIYALNAIVPQIFAANELMLAGVDPNNMRFNRASCFDVGVNCGGVGRIAMEIKIENFA